MSASPQSPSSPPAEFATDFLAPPEAVEPPHGPLLVASDASDASDAAFPMARVVAAHTGAAVQVVSALRPNVMPVYAYDAMVSPSVTVPELLEHRAARVSAQLARLVPEAGTAPWPVTVRSGDPAREIAARAHDLEARLVVVGRGRHGLLERVFGGESVLRLLQLGETPVLAVEATLTQLPRRVVIATDFSLFSVYAAQVALSLCAPGATIEIVHVAPSLSDHAPVTKRFAEEYHAQAQRSFTSFIERIRQPGLTFETTLLEGNASTRLIEHLMAHPADLVASATHGYGFLRRSMLGSVATELLRSAPCSVLCVPGTARTLAAARAQATAPHDRRRLLPMALLDAELASFSARHDGHLCTVELNQHNVGAHAIGHHLPLAGITYESASRTITLMFGLSSEPGRHLSHQLRQCEAVELITDGHDREQVLRVRHAGGYTIVLLE